MTEKQGLDRAKELLDHIFSEPRPSQELSSEVILQRVGEPTEEVGIACEETRKRGWHHTESAKARQSAMMRAYWARKRTQQAEKNTNWDYSI